jgi:anaerobic selenocysteine-containing dehydrogenase
MRFPLFASNTGAAREGSGDDARTDTVVLLLVDRTFGTETLSAMAPALKMVAEAPTAQIHPETIASMGLAEGRSVTVSMNTSRLTVPVKADPCIASGVIVVPRHHLLDWQVFGETRVILERSQLKVGSA